MANKRKDCVCAGCSELKPHEGLGYCRQCYNKLDHAVQNRKDSYKRNYTTEKNRKNMLKSKFGLSTEDYNNILTKQNFSCAICGTHQSEFSKALAVDHCHITGKVCGLLCPDCNTGLGKFKEDPDLLSKASEYLSKTKKETKNGKGV